MMAGQARSEIRFGMIDAERRNATSEKDNMRILMVCPEFPPKIGGMQSHAIGMARYLRQRGLDVLVLTRTCAELHVSWQEAAATDRQSGIPTARCLEIERGLWSAGLPILRHVRDFQPDVVFFTNVSVASCAAVLPVPAVCRTVGNDFIRPWIGPKNKRIDTVRRTAVKLGMRPLVRWFEHKRMAGSHTRIAQLGLRTCGLYLANSHYTRTRLVERSVPVERIHVILGGVEDIFFDTRPEERQRIRAQLGLVEEQPVFVTSCRLVKKKGIDDALRAFAQVRCQYPDAVFLIVGDGPELFFLRELSGELGVGAGARFLGRKPLREVPSYLLASDVFLMPSKETPILLTADVETMGRSACEAAACSLPVIGTRTGGLPEVVMDNVTGLIVEPGKVDALAEAMLKLLAQPELRHKLGERAGEFARANFSWNSAGKTTLDALITAVELGPVRGRDDLAREFEQLSGSTPQVEGEVIELSEDDKLPEIVLADPTAFHCRVWLSRPSGPDLRLRLEKFEKLSCLSIALDLAVERNRWVMAEATVKRSPGHLRKLVKLFKAYVAARSQVRGNGEVVLHAPEPLWSLLRP